MNRILHGFLFLCLIPFYISADPVSRNPSSASNLFKDNTLQALQLEQARFDGQIFHLFSHGRPGELLINGKWLDAEGIVSFFKNQPDAAAFKGLNIYGCEFGKGKTGRAAVSYLSETLGLTISASDDITGKDGDWNLEVGADVSVNGLEGFSGNLQCAGASGGINPSDDFDGDGICNDVDIDDDNDGITDAIESPGCFYTEAEAKVISSVTTELTTSFAIGLSYDATPNTQSSFSPNQNWIGKSIFEITPTRQIAVSAVNFDVGSWPLSNLTTSTFQLEGWNGSSWIPLSAPMYSTGTGLTDFSIGNTVNPSTKYAKYRLAGVTGTCSDGGVINITLTPYQYLASSYPKPTCSTDLDSDTKYNHQDLDSDGDGSSDLSESGVSPATDVLVGPSANSQLNPTAADANNDGLNDSVDADQNGLPNYVSTYEQYALNNILRVSSDIDGDAKTELADYDDDNDGILDVVESPTCYYTEAQARAITSITSELLPYGTNVIGYSYDANVATESGFATGQNWVDKSVFEITPTTPLAISAVNFDVGSWKVSNDASSTFRLQGWNGTAWVNLSETMFNNSAVDFVINNTLQVGIKYPKYRIAGVEGTCYYAGVKEITLTAYQFVQAVHPTPTCSADFDGDGILNHRDLDSDHDGCADAIEGGGGRTTSDLKESDVPGGNSAGSGLVSFGVDDNLGKTVDANGVPTIVSGGQTLGLSQTVASTPCPEIELPVTLVSFTAQQAPEGTKLTWRTADEKDFDRFEIQYSELPQNGFSQIGVVKGGGADYVYTDVVNRNVGRYYRLKMIDTDGTYKYSRIVTITHRNGVELYQVYPNPSNGRNIHVSTNGPITSYKLFNAGGLEMPVKMSGENGQYTFRLAANMVQGLYIITYKTDGQVMSQQFAVTD